MKAAVTTGPGQLEFRDVPAAEPGPAEVVVRTQVVGLCGSDIHLFHGDHPYVRFPVIQGHEFSAVVAELGPEQPGDLRPGDLVAVEPLRPCGTCLACRRGHGNCCRSLEVAGAHIDGALRESLVVPAASCYRVGDLPADLAALVEPTSIGLQAVARSGVGAGDQVVILGAGPIGQTAAMAAADRGAEVLAVDLLDNRLATARGLGAAVTVNASREDVTAAVQAWAGADGPVAVIEATGQPSLVRLAVDLVAHSGTVVVVGITSQDVTLPVVDFSRKEINLLGSRNNAGRFGEAVDLVRRHRDAAGSMITHRFAFGEVPAAMELAAGHPQEAGKVQVRIGDTAGVTA
jgi:L-gulonate 5-dehydrogenase